MTGEQIRAIFVVVLIVFAAATTVQDNRQNERLDRQQATIERQQRQLDRDLLQIGQLNRRVFDLPEVEQELAGGNR